MMNGRADTGALVTGVILDSMLKVKKFLAPVSWERTVARNSWEGLPENIRNKGELLKLYEPKLDLVNFRKKLLSEKYDAIYSPNFPGIIAQLIQAASIDGNRIPFVGNAAWGENTGGSFHQLTKGLTFRGIFARQFSIWEPSRDLKKFRDLIESKTKDPFSSTAVLYYDATVFLGKEIRKCGGNCTRQQLLNSISKDPNYTGIFGEYNFDKRGSNGIDTTFNILEVDGSGFKYLKKFNLNSTTKP